MISHDKIRAIEGQIMEETEGVKNYIKCYNEWKDSNKEVAKTYYDIATQELEHARKLATILVSFTTDKDITPGQKYLIEFLRDLNNEQLQNGAVLVSMNKG